MHKLHELKEMLCEELEEYGSKDKLDVGGLDIVDKLAHAIKNIDKIIESYDGEYSGDMGSYRRSYARRRDRMGRYSGMGYSREFRADLESLMEDAPNDQVKRKIRELMQEV